MLSNGFETPIRLEAVPSRVYFYFTLIVHALAIMALLYPSSLSILLRAGLIMGVAVSCFYHLKISVRVDRGVWVWQQSGLWQGEQDGFQQPWRIQRIFALTNWFVAIRLMNGQQQRQDLLVFCDQLDEHSFRRLRVRLAFFQVEAARPGETI